MYSKKMRTLNIGLEEKTLKRMTEEGKSVKVTEKGWLESSRRKTAERH